MKKLLTYGVLALACISSSVFADTPNSMMDSSVTDTAQTMTSESTNDTSNVPVAEDATVTPISSSTEVTDNSEKPLVTDGVQPKTSESVNTTSKVTSNTKSIDTMPARAPSSDEGGAIGALFALLPLMVYLFISYSVYLIAKKLGEENAWLAFVPFFSLILLLRMAGMSGWWILGLFVPILNIYVIVKVLHNGISLRTGHDAGWTVGLFFLGGIFIPLTAFTFQTSTPVIPSASV